MASPHGNQPPLPPRLDPKLLSDDLDASVPIGNLPEGPHQHAGWALIQGLRHLSHPYAT